MCHHVHKLEGCGTLRSCLTYLMYTENVLQLLTFSNSIGRSKRLCAVPSATLISQACKI
jgi:hypothetical protein